MPTFADRIKELRKTTNATQKQIANAIGIAERNYRRLEAENNPSVETVTKLANYFNISTDYLLGRSDYPFDENAVINIKKKPVHDPNESFLMPRFLFEDDKFKELSSEAKLIYTILLGNYGNDEVALDKKLDKSLKVSEKYLTDELKAKLRVSDDEAQNVIEELSSFGLIEKQYSIDADGSIAVKTPLDILNLDTDTLKKELSRK